MILYHPAFQLMAALAILPNDAHTNAVFVQHARINRLGDVDISSPSSANDENLMIRPSRCPDAAFISSDRWRRWAQRRGCF